MSKSDKIVTKLHDIVTNSLLAHMNDEGYRQVVLDIIQLFKLDVGLLDCNVGVTTQDFYYGIYNLGHLHKKHGS